MRDIEESVAYPKCEATQPQLDRSIKRLRPSNPQYTRMCLAHGCKFWNEINTIPNAVKQNMTTYPPLDASVMSLLCLVQEMSFIRSDADV